MIQQDRYVANAGQNRLAELDNHGSSFMDGEPEEPHASSFLDGEPEEPHGSSLLDGEPEEPHGSSFLGGEPDGDDDHNHQDEQFEECAALHYEKQQPNQERCEHQEQEYQEHQEHQPHRKEKRDVEEDDAVTELSRSADPTLAMFDAAFGTSNRLIDEAFGDTDEELPVVDRVEATELYVTPASYPPVTAAALDHELENRTDAKPRSPSLALLDVNIPPPSTHLHTIMSSIVGQVAPLIANRVPTEARIIRQERAIDLSALDPTKVTPNTTASYRVQERERLRVPAFIARNPGSTMLLVYAVAMSFLVLIFVGGFGISVRFDTDNYAVDGHPATIAWEQWQAAQQVSEAQIAHRSGSRRELESGCDASSRMDQQSLGYKHLSLLFEATGGGAADGTGNLLTPEVLPQVARVERAVRQLMVNEGIAWRNGRHFWQNASNEVCVVDSVLNWFFPQECKTCAGRERFTANGMGTQLADIPSTVSWLMNTTVHQTPIVGHLDRDFAERTAADVAALDTALDAVALAGPSEPIPTLKPWTRHIKSSLPFGVPIAGFSSICDRWAEQKERIDSFVAKLVVELRQWERTAEEAGFRVLYTAPGSVELEYYEALIADLPLIVASVLFLLAYTAFYCGSWAVSVMAVITIALSFPLTLGCYRVICGIDQLGVIHFVSAWVVLGVGADDIFVFIDTWKQSESLVIETTEKKSPNAALDLDSGERGDQSTAAALELRLSWVVREAAYAMLVTTGTTAAAFFGTALSRVRAVREFGLFMGIIVVINYLLVLTFFAASLAYRHKRQQTRRKGDQYREETLDEDKVEGQWVDVDEERLEAGVRHKMQVQGQQTQQSYQSSEHRYALFLRLLLGWHRWVHRQRFLVITVSLVLSVAAAALLPKLQATERVQRVLPIDSNMERVRDAREETNECLAAPFRMYGDSSGGAYCGTSFAKSYPNGQLPVAGYTKMISLSAPIAALVPPMHAPLPSDCGIFPSTFAPFLVPTMLIGIFLLTIAAVHFRQCLHRLFVDQKHTSCSMFWRIQKRQQSSGDTNSNPRSQCPATPSKKRRPRRAQQQQLLLKERVPEVLWALLLFAGLIAILVAITGLATTGRTCGNGSGGESGGSSERGSSRGGQKSGPTVAVSHAAHPTNLPTSAVTGLSGGIAASAQQGAGPAGRGKTQHYPGIFSTLSPLLSRFERDKAQPRDTSGEVILLWGVQGTKEPSVGDIPSSASQLSTAAESAVPVYNNAFDLSRPGMQRSMAAVCAATGGLNGLPLVHASWDPLRDCPMAGVHQRSIQQHSQFPVVPPSAFDLLWLDTLHASPIFAQLSAVDHRHRQDLLGVIDNNSVPSPSAPVSTLSLAPQFAALKVAATFGMNEPGIAIERHYEAWAAVAKAIDREILLNSTESTAEISSTIEALGSRTVFASDSFVRMAVELEFVRGTLTACALTAAIACASVAAFVQNMKLALLVLIAVLELLLLVGGILVLKDDGLGVVEAVSLAVVLGMSVDYIIHIAHAYQYSSLGSRAGRARSALLARAGSVLSSAFSTAGCTAILLFCRIQIFPQFAIIVLVSIGCSVVCALGVFLALVMAVGPTQAPRAWAPPPPPTNEAASEKEGGVMDLKGKPWEGEAKVQAGGEMEVPKPQVRKRMENHFGFHIYREEDTASPRMRDFALQCDSAVLPE
jgi:predicted RND superfamily exporter protein